jgi:hypothetical protein
LQNKCCTFYIDSLADGNYKHTSRYNAKWHLDGRLPIQSFQQPIQHLFLNTTFSIFVDFISILATMEKTSETFNGHPCMGGFPNSQTKRQREREPTATVYWPAAESQIGL